MSQLNLNLVKFKIKQIQKCPKTYLPTYQFMYLSYISLPTHLFYFKCFKNRKCCHVAQNYVHMNE